MDRHSYGTLARTLRWTSEIESRKLSKCAVCFFALFVFPAVVHTVHKSNCKKSACGSGTFNQLFCI